MKSPELGPDVIVFGIPVSKGLIEDAKDDPALRSYIASRLALLTEAELEALLAG